MTLLLAAAVGYLIGSATTANAIASIRGIDLRSGGSGNPGTNNALQLGGYGLAATILSVEIGKGLGATLVGGMIAGDTGAVVCGVTAVLGNVYNLWYRFRGGKGLAISAGVLLGVWPVALPLLIATIALLAVITHSSGAASLGAIVVMVMLGILWAADNWPNSWGIDDVSALPYLALAMGIILAPKHLIDTNQHFRQPSRT